MECDIKYTKTEYDVYQLFVKQGVLRKWNERSECNVSLTQPKRNYNIYELHNCNVCNLAEMMNNGIMVSMNYIIVMSVFSRNDEQ